MDMDAVIAGVASAVGLAEGRSGVSDVLRAIARSEPVAVRDVSRMAELPVPIVAAVAVACAALPGFVGYTARRTAADGDPAEGIS